MPKITRIETSPNNSCKNICKKDIDSRRKIQEPIKTSDAFITWHKSTACCNCPIVLQKEVICPIFKKQINNFRNLPNNSARGESLSSKKNRYFLKELKKLEIDTIIDLRDKYTSTIFPQLCKENNLKYFNIPIDANNVADKSILEKLPEFFKITNKGGYYIACAQGLHRTDIALAIDYVFNPKEKPIPILYGHFRNGDFKFDDIARRLHSLKRNMGYQYTKELGWGEDFYEKFYKRKNQLKEYNQNYFKQVKYK